MKGKLKYFFLILALFQIEGRAFAKARYVTCPEQYPKTIRVPFNNVMIMQFPEKPKHSLPGKNDFDFQYIDKDIGIKALRQGGQANFFVYLGKKRCAFKLVTTTTYSDDIVVVNYPKEKTVEAKYVE